MTEKEMEKFGEEPGNYGEYGQLAAILGKAGFLGESRIKVSLKRRLLVKAKKKNFAFGKWLIPAAAAALAALFLTVNLKDKEITGPAYYPAYETASDAYAACGKQGLKDYLSGPRF